MTTTSPPEAGTVGRPGEGEPAAPARGPDILAPIRGELVLAGVIAAIGALLQTAPLFAAAEIARRMLDGRRDVWGVVAVLAVALVLRYVFILASGMYTHMVDLQLSLRIRQDVLTHLRRLPLAWFTSRNSGTVKKVVEDDTAALHQLVAHSVFEITTAAVPALVALVYLFVLDWRLALLVLLPIVIGIAGYSLAMHSAGPQMALYNEWLEKLSAAAIEFVNGIAVVKSFGQSGRAHRRFTEASEGFGTFFLGWMRASTKPSIAMEIAVSPLSMLAVLSVGGYALVRWGGLSTADFVAFMIFGVTITSGLMVAIFSMHSLDAAFGAKKRIEAFLAEPELPVADHPATPADPTGPEGRRVRFEGVDFSYGDTRVLHGVDLELAPGTVTALVGPSGSGKSTLASLLPRFADPEHGRITLGGVDLRELDPADLYRTVSFVFQDSRLLRGTIAENIALARPGADRSEVRRAAAEAQILDRLDTLPRGLDSVVGEDAVLSGGETQRVCIARAILADCPVLVLDEATASADPENEARIQDALSNLARGRTLLVIAHRLSTITGADRIAVLDSGRLVEVGTHPELLATGGLYARMWEADRRTLAAAGHTTPEEES